MGVLPSARTENIKVTRPSIITKALTTLPTSLDETYERMLTQIDHETRPHALKLLRWLACVKSPPSLGELVDASVVDLTREGHVEVRDWPGLDDPLHILSGLVIATGMHQDSDNAYDEDDTYPEGREGEDDQIELAISRQQVDKNTKIRLAHFSVKKYLESKRILEGSAGDFYFESSREHKTLSHSCLIHLMHYSSSEEKVSTGQDFTAFPLLQYAAESWFYHSALQEADTVTSEVAFLRDHTASRDWLRVHQPDGIWKRSFAELNDLAKTLYYASFLGLRYVVDELIETGANVNAQGGGCGGALQAASVGGYKEVVQMLLGAGADVNTQGGKYSSVLQTASEGAHVGMVQMLVHVDAT
nr:ankyrin repeat, bromo and btb domain-containing protein [Quercus suber]